MRANPPWTDKILSTNWAKLERLVGAAWMPVPATAHKDLKKERERLAHLIAWDKLDVSMELKAYYLVQIPLQRARIAKLERARKLGYREYGCGHYGCVMPTATPGMVIKVTSDATEASFVAAYLSLPANQRPVGIVPYHRIVALPGSSRLRRQIFVLWREEADHVGRHAILEWIKTGAREFERQYLTRSYSKTEALLLNCRDQASKVRTLTLRKPNARALLQEGIRRMDDAWQRGHVPRAAPGMTPQRIGWHLASFQQNAQQLQTEQMGDHLGRALLESFEAGLLLADVHLGNIGMPTGALLEEIGHTLIITDPGHAIALDDRYDGVRIEEL